MHPNTTTIERAFELAKSGQYVSVEEIKRRLHAEGYFAGQVKGRELSAQLKAAIDTARKAKSEG
jgi:exonuclease VII large subunit